MSRFILPFARVDDKNGHPLDGAKLYFYESGTNTPKDTYSDSVLATKNTNPVIADSQGQFGNIFLNGVYRVKLTDKNDVTQPDYPVDNVPSLTGTLFTNVANMKLSLLAVGQTAETQGYSTAGDGGGAKYLIVAPQSFDGYGDHQLANGNIAVLQYDGALDARQFGAVLDGVADDTAKITACSVYASGSDNNSFLISSDKIYFTSELDTAGATVYGNNTVISGGGRLIGHKQLVGIQVNGYRQDLNYNFEKESAPSNPKLIWMFAANEFYVLTPGKGLAGGACFKMVKDVVTSTGSLGVTAELFRNTRVFNCVGQYGWRGTATAETGTWSDHTVAAADVGHSGASVFRNVTARKTSTTSDYTEFNTTVDQSGKLNVAIYGTAGSTTSLTIAVDGVVQKTLDPRTWANRIYAIDIEAVPGARVIRITNAGTGTLYVVGINYHRISEVIPSLDYDDVAIYRDATEPFYISDDSSANDYAIEERSSGLLGGSYHGGETVSAIEYVLDGIGQTISIGDVVCRKDFYLRQISLIDWGSSVTMSIESLQIFRDGQHELQFSGDGSNLQVRTIFAGMSAINESFNRVVFPVSQAIPANGEVFLGRTTKIIMRDPLSDAIAITDITLSPNEDSVKGGPRIFAVSGSYNKVYYNPVSLGERSIDKLSFVTVRTFK